MRVAKVATDSVFPRALFSRYAIALLASQEVALYFGSVHQSASLDRRDPMHAQVMPQVAMRAFACPVVVARGFVLVANSPHRHLRFLRRFLCLPHPHSPVRPCVL